MTGIDHDTIPRDSHGESLNLMDYVIIEHMPPYLWSDPGCEHLKNFEGLYGIIRLEVFDGVEYSLRSAIENYAPGWRSKSGELVFVNARQIWEERVVSYSFWIRSRYVKRIPHNVLINSIFSELTWQIQDADGPSSSLAIKKGMLQYSVLERILSTPYNVLVNAHNAAEGVLAERSAPSG